MDPARVTVATVVDDRPPYVHEVELLFASLERFGGRMAAARRRAYFIDTVSPATERALVEIGVEVRVVPIPEPRFRLANKLAMFGAEAQEDGDLVLGLDTDIVVAGDFADRLDAGLLQAKQPDGDLLPLEMWRALFAHFGLELPSERHPTSLLPGWTHAYFNTGVVAVPTAVLGPLTERWMHYLRGLLDDPTAVPGLREHLYDLVPKPEGAMPDELAHLYFADQWALSLARHDLRLPYTTLPLAMNFPTIYLEDQEPGNYIRERFMPHFVEPLLLHHHHDVEGGLKPTGYAAPDRVIARVNEALFG